MALVLLSFLLVVTAANPVLQPGPTNSALNVTGDYSCFEFGDPGVTKEYCASTLKYMRHSPGFLPIHQYGPYFETMTWRADDSNCRILLQSEKDSDIAVFNFASVLQEGLGIFEKCRSLGFGGLKTLEINSNFTVLIMNWVEASSNEPLWSKTGKPTAHRLHF